MDKPATARGYFSLSLSFLRAHFLKLWWAFMLPLLGAVGICGGLFWAGIEFFHWIDAWIGQKEGFWWGLVSWSVGLFGIFVALALVYLMFVPLLRALLTPLLGMYAEKVYFIRRGEAFDTTPIWHPTFWRNLGAGILGGLLLAFYQLPIKILSGLALIFIPGGPLASVGVEFLVNRHFAGMDNFGLLLMAGPRPVVAPKRLKAAIEQLGPLTRGYRSLAALLLCFPLINVFFILINVTAAALILADRGGPELQGVE
ncbi:MAG: hypothetical protein CMH56_13220 [Myxococcales bacterium]|nr:hypothetical protein [Myxococcales bacterium]